MQKAATGEGTRDRAGRLIGDSTPKTPANRPASREREAGLAGLVALSLSQRHAAISAVKPPLDDEVRIPRCFSRI